MRHIFQALTIFAAATLFACGGGGGGGGNDAGTNENPLACGSDTAQVTAQQLYDGIVKTKCQTCHFTGAGAATGGNIVMDSVETLKANAGKVAAYATTGSDLKVVDANHPENSTMFLKVSGGSPTVKGPMGESVGGAMPQGAAPLTDAEKKQVKDWICSGAQ